MDRSNTRIYTYGCQKSLKRLTKDYNSEKSWLNPEWSIPIGTVVYYWIPVEISSKNEWIYQIKTTGEIFNGNSEKIEGLLNSILQIIKQGEINDI